MSTVVNTLRTWYNILQELRFSFSFFCRSKYIILIPTKSYSKQVTFSYSVSTREIAYVSFTLWTCQSGREFQDLTINQGCTTCGHAVFTKCLCGRAYIIQKCKLCASTQTVLIKTCCAEKYFVLYEGTFWKYRQTDVWE